MSQATSDSTTNIPAEDAAEYAARLERVRDLMRAQGFDALLISDNDDAGTPQGGAVRYLANVGVPMQYGPRPNLILVLPLDGDPVLIVPPTGLASLPGIVRARSWVPRVVCSAPEDLLESLKVLSAAGTPNAIVVSDIVAEIENAGLAQSRIGLCGQFPALGEVTEKLSGAHLERAAIDDDAGVSRDLLEFARARGKSPWEITRLERAQACVEVGTRTFRESLVEGSSYGETQARIDFACRMAGAEEVFWPSSKGSQPWQGYSMPGWIEGRYAAGDMVAFEVNARVDGYIAQLPRTWIVGGNPTKNQARVYDTARRCYEAMLARVEVGVSGGELWDAGIGVIEDAGLAPWARHGHGMGLSMSEWFSLLPGDKGRVQEGQSIVVHATVIDKATGDMAMVGDQLVVEGSAARTLAQTISLDLE